MSDLVTYGEIEEMSGGQLTYGGLRMLSSRGEMPERAHVKYPVWDKHVIRDWLRGRGITPQDPK